MIKGDHSYHISVSQEQGMWEEVPTSPSGYLLTLSFTLLLSFGLLVAVEILKRNLHLQCSQILLQSCRAPSALVFACQSSEEHICLGQHVFVRVYTC